MRGSSRYLFTAAAALLMTFSVFAEDPKAPAKDADNTKRNASDRTGETLTPIDQGTSKSDLAITAAIRKEVVAAKDMSVNAQNVKIITNAGKVTLRGPVDTADEKRLIGEIATRHAQPGSVDNQLEVKANTTKTPKPKGD